MKKELTSVILAAAILAALPGCTAKKENGGESGGDVLTWYVPGDKQVDMQSVMDAANAITEPAIGAKIDLRMIDSGSYSEKMQMMMASGEVFDLMFTGYVNNYNQAVKRGGLMDITDMIDKYAPKLKDEISPLAFEQAYIDGKIYAVPNYQTMSLKPAIAVRKDLADEFGLDESKIKTINDMEPFMEWVKNNHSEVFAYRPQMGMRAWTDREYFEVFNGFLASQEELHSGKNKVTLQPAFENDVFVDGMYKLYEWYQKGYIRKDILTVTDDSGDYKIGKYAVCYNSWKPGAEKNMKNATGYDYDFIIMDKDRSPFADGAVNAMTGISRTSKNPEKAMKFIELVNTNKELYNLFCFGIEGKHYKKDDAGHIIVDPNSGYFQNNSDWMFGNQFNAYILSGNEDNIWEETKKLNDEAVEYPLSGFTFDNSNVTAEMTAIDTVNSQFSVLNEGAQNPDEYFEDFKERQKEAGVDKVLAEYQRQIDEFLANKK